MFFSLSSGATWFASMPPLITIFTLTRSANATASLMSARGSPTTTSGSFRSATGTSASSVQSTVLPAPALA